MIVESPKLEDNSKVYIFPSDRKLYPDEIPVLSEKITDFLEDLSEVDSFFEIKYQRFIIILVSGKTPLSVSQNEALVLLMFSFEKELNLSLIDKVKVFFKQGKYVQCKEVPDFKKLIKNRGVSKNTIVFNNFIHSKSEYDCCWEVPASESWISHLF
ncbi:MAG: ABC transporter ATPase [Bacteroidota bacterium]